jgi:general secretion pathway protein A
MARLIGLWNPKITIPKGENVCHSLSQQGLECYKDSGQWSDLSQLNRPAILSLNIAPGTTQYALLRSLNGDSAVLDSDSGPLRLPLACCCGRARPSRPPSAPACAAPAWCGCASAWPRPRARR